MRKNNQLNELIYEYYESRILFGVYRYGERLNSVPQICASFGWHVIRYRLLWISWKRMDT